VSLRIGTVLAVLLLAAAIAGCSSAGPLGEYRAARTLHLAPDGRLIVTDLGSGRNDGAVVAVEVASGRQTVLMRDLPSTHHSGQAHADLAGPSGAAMAADGTVCATIGDATTPKRRVRRPALHQRPDGRPGGVPGQQQAAEQPLRRRLDGGEGWYVSDGAANNVVHVDRTGKVTIVAYVPDLAARGLGRRHGQGVPAGLTLGPDRTLFVALYGGTPFDGPPAAVVSLAPDAAIRPGQVKPRLVALMQHPIALAMNPDGLAVADYGGAPGERGKGELRLLSGVGAAADGPGRQQPVGRSRLLASGLDRPTGLARLPDGRWAIAETGHTELTVLSSSRS
jgi:hypothetical protein